MTLVQTNRASFTSAEAITSATQTTITRTSATDGLPGDSDGPASGEYAVVFTDGTNFEIAYVTGGQGTTTLTLQRAAELIGGTQTALSSVPSGTTFYAVATAAGLQPASYDTTVLTKLSLAPVAYWKLNDAVGSSTAADSSGNGYTLTVNGTVTFGEASVVPSDSETSAQSDGSTGYLSAATFPALVPSGSSPFSILMAFKGTAAFTSNGEGVQWGNFGTAGHVVSFGFAPELFGSFYGNNLGPVPGGSVNTIPVLAGLTWDGFGAALWMNGQRRESNYPTLNIAASGLELLRGGDGYTKFPIGRVAIFAGVLTPKDWALLMQAFTGVS